MMYNKKHSISNKEILIIIHILTKARLKSRTIITIKVLVIIYYILMIDNKKKIPKTVNKLEFDARKGFIRKVYALLFLEILVFNLI